MWEYLPKSREKDPWINTEEGYILCVQDDTKKCLAELKSEKEGKDVRLKELVEKQFRQYVLHSPLLVYTHFQEIPQNPSQEQMTAFLKSVYEKRERLKKEIFWLQNTPKEVSELVLQLFSELIKKYLTQLNSKEGIDLSIRQIYQDVKTILGQLQKNLALHHNVFSQDIELFLKHFFTSNSFNEKTGKDEEKWLRYTEFAIKKLLWNQIDTKEEYNTLYDMMTSSVGMVIDESKLSSQDISKKLDILKQIPQVTSYIQGNQDFSILFTIISKIGNHLDTAKSVAFFQEVKWDFFILLFSDPKENPEKYKQTRILFLSKMINYITEEIFWSLRYYDNKTQREVLHSFFQLSFLKPYTTHPLYQVAKIFQGNEQVNQGEIYQNIFSLLWMAVRKENINQNGDFNDFIDTIAKNFTKLAPEEQKKVLDLLKSLIPEEKATQRVNQYMPIDWGRDSKREIFSKVFSNTKWSISEKLNSFLQKTEQLFLRKWINLLAPSSNWGTNNLLSDESYRKIVWESLKKLWTVFSDDFTLSMRELLLNSVPEKFQLKGDTQILRAQNSLSENMVKKILDIIKDKLSIALKHHQKGIRESSRLSQKEFLGLVASIIKNEIWKEKFNIPVETLEQIIFIIWKNLLNEYSKNSNPLNSMFETRLAFESAGETVSQIHLFIDSLYTLFWEQSTEVSRQELIHSLLKQYKLWELDEVKICWKSFPKFLGQFVKNIDKTQLKAFLFEKKNIEIIQKILNPKVSKSEKIQLWAELSLKLFKKIPQSETLLIDSLIGDIYSTFWREQWLPQEKTIHSLLTKYGLKSLTEIRIFWKSFWQQMLLLIRSTDKVKLQAFFTQKENKEILQKLIDPKGLRTEKQELAIQLGLSLYTLFLSNQSQSEEEQVFANHLKQLSQKDLKKTAKFLSQYSQNMQKIITLYSRKMRTPNIPLSGKDFQDIKLFAECSFSLVSYLIELYGEKTLGLFQNKKLFSTLQGEKKIEPLLWNLSEIIKNQNTSLALGSFISTWLDENQAKNHFFVEYFSRRENKEDFINAVFQAFWAGI